MKQGAGITDLGRLGPGAAAGAPEWNAAKKERAVTLQAGEGRIITITD